VTSTAHGVSKFGRILPDPGGVYPPGAEVRLSAVISDDQLYRYALVRRWHYPGLLDLEHGRAPLTVIMLNPSTADGDVDDPTIRRCVGFARALELAGVLVVNLYAYRATKPADLWAAEDPVGPHADKFILEAAVRSTELGAPLVAAWGAHARPDRVEHVLELIDRAGARLTALGTTKAGQPRHPLYLPATARPARWPA
jgi:hypothetical protein